MNRFVFVLIFTVGLLSAQTEIIAHRGYWKGAKTAQNSLEALEKAQALKVFGSEFDVRRTLDGVLVVNHDPELEGVVIANSPYKSLHGLKLSNGEKIPTLSHYLKAGKKDSKLKLIVEIKPVDSPELESTIAREVLKLVRDHNLEEQTLYISFSLGICEALKALDPKVHVQYLAGDLDPQSLKNKGIDGLDYHYKVLLDNPTWISQAKSLGLSTNAWTVNDLAVFETLRSMGIDQVTTDLPEQLLKP